VHLRICLPLARRDGSDDVSTFSGVSTRWNGTSFVEGVGFSGLVSRSRFKFQIYHCWSWCSRLGDDGMPLRHDLRWFVGSFGGGIGFLLGGFVVFCGVVEAQPISGEAVKQTWSRFMRLSFSSDSSRLWLVDVFLAFNLCISSSPLDLLGCGDGHFSGGIRSLVLKDGSWCCEYWLFPCLHQCPGPNLASKASLQWVLVALLRYGCPRPFSPLTVSCLNDKEEYKLGKITDYQLLQATSWGLRHPRGKTHLPGITVN
ncbi:hypothetical protein HID58_071418, partial [Brassica napus]